LLYDILVYDTWYITGNTIRQAAALPGGQGHTAGNYMYRSRAYIVRLRTYQRVRFKGTYKVFFWTFFNIGT